MKKKTDRIRSYIVIAIMLIISIVALIGSIQIYQKRPGLANAGMYPLLMSGLMVASMIGAILEARRLSREEKNVQEEQKEEKVFLAALKAEFPPRTVFLGACIIGYGILFRFIGFYISTAIFMVVSMLGLYRGKRIKMVLGVTLLTLICVYGIIEKLFNIPLP